MPLRSLEVLSGDLTFAQANPFETRHSQAGRAALHRSSANPSRLTNPGINTAGGVVVGTARLTLPDKNRVSGNKAESRRLANLVFAVTHRGWMTATWICGAKRRTCAWSVLSGCLSPPVTSLRDWRFFV